MDAGCIDRSVFFKFFFIIQLHIQEYCVLPVVLYGLVMDGMKMSYIEMHK